MLTDEELRAIAEAHWDYNLKLINALLNVTRVLFIEGVIHGYKHGREEKEVKE